MRRKKYLLCLGLSVFIIQNVLTEVPRPEKVLGFSVGADRKIADAHQIVDYFQRLDRASDRVTVNEVGKTTMGNPFLVVIITSSENHKNLAAYRSDQQLLADPGKITDKKAEEIIAKGKTVVMINCSIHASEIGASQMSMKLAYDLATGEDLHTREILDNVILLLLPMHNPDGIQMVADWYKKNLGTPWEGGRLPFLYHKYVGHDNNRDWYMFTQIETRLTLLVHNAWHPQIILDMHQMGSEGARLFVPPYVDPYEPNIDPILEQQVAVMGTFIASELTSEGKEGVIHSSIFDAWTPSRAYHHYHGGIRILTEAASVKVATPITVNFNELSDDVQKSSVKMPLPWKGGQWTLKDIVEYDYSAARAVLTHAARMRENWLRNFYQIHKNGVTRSGPPFAFLVPLDQRDVEAASQMMTVLRMGGVEVHRANAPFQADGCLYPEGTCIVYMAQPYGSFAKTLLEKQKYPEIRETPNGPLRTPYDAVAHTLPLLMGVKSVEVEKPFEVKAIKLEKIEKPKGKVDIQEEAFGYLWGHASNQDMVALNRLVKKGYKVFWAAEPFGSGGETYPAGTMIVQGSDGLVGDLESLADSLCVCFKGVKERPKIQVYDLKPVRIGLYKSWTASIDEGWTRWVLEQYEFPYTSIFDKDVRAGDLRRQWDVLILPDMEGEAIVEGLSEKEVPPEYAGGIGEIGVENIKQFVENGGSLIALNQASELPIQKFYLSIENSVEALDRKSFFIPGSILKVLNDTSHPIAYGYERDAAIFFRRSPVFTVKEGRSVVNYPVHNPLLSGWVNGEEHLLNRSALVDVSFGEGRILLIGFPVLYRGQAHGTFRFLFNAIYYGQAKLMNF